MRSCTLLFFFILSLPNSPAIKIQVGKFTFMLESVLKLKKLLEEDGMDLTVAASKACSDPKLPAEFIPVCGEPDAPDIFVKLIESADDIDECEICANPACPGCR